MFLRNDNDYHTVDLLPQMEASQFDPSMVRANEDICATIERFTYRRLRIQRDTWVFIPASWYARYGGNLNDLEGHVMDRLVRGYIGNNQ